jgi:hypothetical protein
MESYHYLIETQIAEMYLFGALGIKPQFLVLHQPEEINTRQEQLSTNLFKVATSVDSLFSEAAWDQFSPALSSMEGLLREPPPPEQRTQRYNQLLKAILDALSALYDDMGIPPIPPWPWIQKHAWQPLCVRVWERPWQYWHRRGWSTLQRWGGQMRVWDHPQQYWRTSCYPTLQRWKARARTRIPRL